MQEFEIEESSRMLPTDNVESSNILHNETNNNYTHNLDNNSIGSNKRLTIGNKRLTEAPHHKKVIIPNESIHQFIQALTILFIIVTVQIIIPQIVIICTKRKINYLDFFNRSYWMIIVLMAIIVGISLLVYFLKKEFITKGNSFAIPLFLFYLLTLTLVVTFISFYSVYLALGVCVIQFTAFGVKLILELIETMRSKPYIQLIVLYSIVFIGFILYCFLVKEEIVGCFIYLIFLMIFCTYATFEFKAMIIEFCNKFQLDYKKEINMSIYALSLMNANVDILVCCFK